MSILVTGGAGYIGSHMVWEMLDHGAGVVVLDNLSTGHKTAVAPGAELVIGSVHDRALLDEILGRGDFDTILHFAGSVVVPDSVADPLSYYHNNVEGTRGLIEAAVSHGVANFVFSSTAAVYGTPDKMPASEDTPCLPESPYGWSKYMAERILQDTGAAHGLNYAILRYFNVAGADPEGRVGQSTPRATHLIKVACEAALGKRAGLEIYGTDYPTRDGTCLRDFIHVSDLVAAHRLAVDHLRRTGQSVLCNLGYGQGATVREVVEAVERVSGESLDITKASRRPGDVVELVADAQRARETLGWQPQYQSLEFIVRTALDWEARLTPAA